MFALKKRVDPRAVADRLLAEPNWPSGAQTGGVVIGWPRLASRHMAT
jgi:hypothetical protein